VSTHTTTHDNTGVTLSRQASATGPTVAIGAETTPTGLARRLADALQDEILAAVRAGLEGRTIAGVVDIVEEHELALADGTLSGLLVGIGRGDHRAAAALMARLRNVGRGRSTTADAHLLGHLLALNDNTATTPTVTVRVRRDLRDARHDHRAGIAQLLATLATGSDVRLVGTGVTLRWLERDQRAYLPVDARLDAPPTEEAVLAAREALAPDGPHTTTLRALAERPSQRATYDALADAVDVGRATLRSRLLRLREHDLVTEGLSTPEGTAVELRPAGAAYLTAVDEAVGHQLGLDESVGEVSNSSENAVLSRRQAREEGEREAVTTANGRTRHRLPDRHDVHYLSRREAVPAAVTPSEHGIAVINYPVKPREDRAAPGWGYDADRDQLVVSAEWDNPLQYTVCLARALTDGRTWRHVLDEDRLADSDLTAQLAEHRDLLRCTRCLGYLPDHVDGPGEYAERLQKARDDLLKLTGDLRRENYECDRDEFRAHITREALGLAGTAAHLLDLAGVEIVREVRIPEYSRNFSVDRRGALVENLATIAAIQSSYGHHSVYRQLLEQRPEKLRQTPEAVVDATAPLGKLIGSIVVVGDLGDRRETLADALRDGLAEPGELRDDAPEIGVRIPIETEPGRQATAQVAHRLGASKRLEPGRATVSVLDALARTAYDVADALAALGSESTSRELRPSEVRYALAHLDATRLLERTTPPAARRLVRSLLDANRPLPRAALTDRAGVSRTSSYTHLPRLEGLGLVEETTDGYRLAIAFHTDDERYSDRLPAPVTEPNVAPRDIVYELATAVVDDPRRAGDPDDPIFGAWLDLPADGVPDVSRLSEVWPWLEWALRTVRALCWRSDNRLSALPATPESTPAMLGTAPEQTAVTRAGE
jgi:DNA-binding transcriptional ArsR family regulator